MTSAKYTAIPKTAHVQLAASTSGEILRGTYHSSIVLSDPTTQDPLTVAATGVISPATGEGVTGAAGTAWTVTNLGTIESADSNGVDLPLGGFITNGHSGSNSGVISGAGDGILITAEATVVNYGTISGNQSGVLLGLLVNLNGPAYTSTLFNAGTIAGSVSGVEVAGPVTNTGLITASSGAGVALASVSVQGGNIPSVYGAFLNSGTVRAAGVGVYAGGIVTNTGTIIGSQGVVGEYIVDSAGVGIGAPIVNKGLIVGTSGPGVLFANTAVGETVTNYGTLQGSNGTAVAFTGAGNELVIEPGAKFVGAITRFNASDTIDLAHLVATRVDFSGGTLTVSAGNKVVEELTLPGSFASADFVLTSDNHGGTKLNLGEFIGNYGYTLIVGGGVPTTIATTSVIAVGNGDAIINQSGSAATLTNLGTITATGADSGGVRLNAGGFVTNGGSGSQAVISGDAAGVAITGGGGSLVNSGTILGTGKSGNGLYLGAGGFLYNGPGGGDGARAGAFYAGGLIAGAAAGLAIGTSSAYVNNCGVIAATGALGVGVALFAASAAENAAAAGSTVEACNNCGTISGQSGVMAGSGNATVTNSGVIAATGGPAVGLAGGSDRLIVDPGAVFQGLVSGGGGQSVLELAATTAQTAAAAAAKYGTLAALGTSFVAFGLVAIDAGAHWQLSGTAASLSNHGAVAVGGGTLVLGTVVDQGGGGLIALRNGGVVEIAAADAGQTVAFEDTSGGLKLDAPAAFAGAVTGFQAGDTIDLAGVTGIVGYSGGVLSLIEGGTTVDLRLSLASPSANPDLIVNTDGGGGILLGLGSGTGPVLSGTYANGVVLDSAVQNPTTVTASGDIGNDGIAVLGQPGYAWTVTNYGMIAGGGSYGVGVLLQSGGELVNQAAIAGDSIGIDGYGGATTVLNYGAITSAAGTGIYVAAGGMVVNGASGWILGDGDGVYLVGTGTVVNAGTIAGYGGTAVQLTGAQDRLVVDPGAVFNGSVTGAGRSRLELAAGGYGGLYGFGAYVTGFSNLIVDGEANWTLSGDVSGARVTNAGVIDVDNGNALVFGAVGGTHGTIDLGGGGIAEFTGVVAKGQLLVFTDAYGVLQLSDPQAFAARISGFQAGDVIDLVGAPADGFTYAKGKLTLTDAGNTVAVLSFAGHYTQADFQLADDGSGGTEVVLTGAALATSSEPYAAGAAQPAFAPNPNLASPFFSNPSA